MMVLDPNVIATTGFDGPNNIFATSSRELSIATGLFYVFDDRLDSDGGIGHGAVIQLREDSAIEPRIDKNDAADAMLAILSIEEFED